MISLFHLEIALHVAKTTLAASPSTSAKVTVASRSPLKTKYNYAEVIKKSLLFYYAQRSGRLPLDDNPIPYRGDSALGDVGQYGEDLTGGYYDGKCRFSVSCYIFN